MSGFVEKGFSYSTHFEIQPQKDLHGVESMFVHYVTDSGRTFVTIGNKLSAMTEDKVVGLFSHETVELLVEWVRALDYPHLSIYDVTIHNLFDMPVPSGYAEAYHGLPIRAFIRQ